MMQIIDQNLFAHYCFNVMGSGGNCVSDLDSLTKNIISVNYWWSKIVTSSDVQGFLLYM